MGKVGASALTLIQWPNPCLEVLSKFFPCLESNKMTLWTLFIFKKKMEISEAKLGAIWRGLPGLWDTVFNMISYEPKWSKSVVLRCPNFCYINMPDLYAPYLTSVRASFFIQVSLFNSLVKLKHLHRKYSRKPFSRRRFLGSHTCAGSR